MLSTSMKSSLFWAEFLQKNTQETRAISLLSAEQYILLEKSQGQKLWQYLDICGPLKLTRGLAAAGLQLRSSQKS